MIPLAGWTALAVMCTAGDAVRGGAWLDASPVASWNAAGAPVPRAPVADPVDPHLREQCARLVRPATSAADRAVTAAGWELVGPSRTFGDTEVVTAQSAVDGMCRPWGYQVLVFSGGRFAGTLSPHPMDARTDGAAQVPDVPAADTVVLGFSRYAPQDPMCCPSRVSTAEYRIERRDGVPVVVLAGVHTSSTVEPAAPAITGRRWQLVRIQMMDDTVLVPETPDRYTLELGPDGRATVGAGCNRGSGAYALDGRSLTFGPMATTRALCPPGSISDRYLRQLSFVASWIARDGRLFLATRADGSILEFAPAPAGGESPRPR